MTLPLHSSWHHYPDMKECSKRHFFRISSCLFEPGVLIPDLKFSTTKLKVEKKREKGIRRFPRKCQKILFDPFAVRLFALIHFQDNVANTQEYNFNFSEVKQQLLCWLSSEWVKNRQPLPLQKWISVRFEFKHDSNLKLRNAQESAILSVLFANQ